MTGNKELVTSLGHSYEVIKKSSRVKNIIKDRHDTLIDLCTKEPDLFYVDCDMILKSIPEFKPGAPYFKRHRSGCPDEMLVYVNGCTEFFKNIYLEKDKRGIQDVLWWFRKIIRTKNVYFFDSDCYDCTEVIKRDENLLASYGYERYKKGNN